MKIINKIVFACLIALVAIKCGGGKDEDADKANTPPSITEVTIIPENPTVSSEITVQILSSDKQGDPITYKVEWFLNGNKIGEGMSMTRDEVAKGDEIYAEVTPYDGKQWGEVVKTDKVTVGGSPPRILSVTSAPESVFVTTPRVVVTALAEDPDNDSLDIIIRWVVNDQVLADTSNELKLQQYNLQKGDRITATAYVDDGEYRSEPYGFEILVANAPPVFRTEIDSVKCRSDSVNYKLPIFDPDNDDINYELLEAPDGISIDPETGTIYGNAGDMGSFEVLIRATDTDGAYLEARFTLTTPELSTQP